MKVMGVAPVVISTKASFHIVSVLGDEQKASICGSMDGLVSA
jgi:hypothetical protein